MIIHSQIKHIFYDIEHTIKLDGIDVKYYCQYLILPGGNWSLSSYRKQCTAKLTTNQKKRVKYLLSNFEIDLK